jgi:hypothetical protein
MVMLGVVLVAVAIAVPQPTPAREPPRVLVLIKSSGFEHAVIKQRDAEPSLVESVLARLSEHGFDFVFTKDASRINAQELSGFDAVLFYTTGDLTRSGTGDGSLFGGDGHTAMAETGLAELLTWIEAGGSFLGFHCAADTFHGEDGKPSPYVTMLGGEFRIHGREFAGTVRAVDRSHPAARSLPETWTIADEWYLFKNTSEDRHVLAVLDPGAERARQPQLYDVEPYPVIWTREPGRGHVYYNAMGHRPDVWDDATFQAVIVDALKWATAPSPP